jgi:outer membrane protein assembly factor BamB
VKVTIQPAHPGIWLLLSVLALPARADNWPAWRGPQGDGHCTETNLPVKWSRTENVRWKVPLPGPGNSTPVVWGDRIFVTQATDKGTRRSLLCLARADGKELWKRTIIHRAPEPTHATNPYCSASPVTDGELVIVSHGSAGMVCYDFQGKEQWRKPLGKLHHVWGNASSPVLYGDLAILWCGPGERQFLLAVNKKTGDTVWEHQEPGGNRGDDSARWQGSWCTPLIIHLKDHDELIVGVPEKLKAFDPLTGKERWSCAGLGKLVYSSPVYGRGIVVAMSGYGGPALAVRAGGRGDVTRTHRLWHRVRGNPQRIGSPVVIGDHVYLVNEDCTVKCFELTTGKSLWLDKRLEGQSWGSLVAADGRLYVTGMAGDTLVLAARPTFERLAKNALGERVLASMAVSDGDLFIRTYEHLWCIGRKK